MGFTYSFIDNKSYGVDDINGLAANLVGAGVTPFVSKSSYTPSYLNSLTSALTTKGTQLDGCKCTKTSTGYVKVSQGIIFFENGVCLSVDSSGYSVYVSSTANGYIVAQYDVNLQKATISFKTEMPEEGQFVKLADIVNGNVVDSRTFARSKFGSIGANAIVNTNFVYCDPELVTNEKKILSSYVYEYRIAKLSGIDFSVFNYVISGYYYSRMDHISIFDLKSKKFLVYNSDDKSFKKNYVRINDTFVFEENTLFYHIGLNDAGINITPGNTMDMPLILC